MRHVPLYVCARALAHVIRPFIWPTRGIYARNTSETNPAGLNETYYFNSFTGTRNMIRLASTRERGREGKLAPIAIEVRRADNNF